MSFLTGYRTYICGFLLVVAAGLHALGYISESVYRTLEGVLVGGGLAALRASKDERP